MISRLSIRDFAVIKELELELHPGLNIITGETGAGKSVIIEAVSMALGSRADTDYIRHGAQKATVSLLAEWDDPALAELLEQEGIPAESPLVIKREISSQSRSLCRVNGEIVPLSVLSAVCKHIADIHGQYDHQSLLDPERHTAVLDMYGGDEIKKVLEKTSEAYRAYFDASSELMRLRRTLSESKRERELLTHELAEIKAAGISAGEADALEDEIRMMKHSGQIRDAVCGAYDDLYGGDYSGDSALSRAMSQLSAVKDFSADLAEVSEAVESAYYQIDELSSKLRHLRESFSFSEAELDEKIERLETIHALERKFGGSEESILKYAADAEEKLRLIEDSDERIAELEASIKSAREAYDVCAARLTKLRAQTAADVEKAVDKELSELNFSGASFGVEFTPCGVSEGGSEKAQFMIAANPGEPLKPLAKVASGGELSRVMLALKRILGDADSIPTMIFDEIDTGISGATAGIVGEKLRSISRDHQIVCITHLPQIACLGDHHYRIEKNIYESSAETTVTPLGREERVEELARLLSGTNVTDSARNRAAELLKEAGN